MDSKGSNTRTWVLLSAFVLVLLIIGYNLTIVQIANGEYYSKQVQEVNVARQYIPAVRGEIVDRYGRPFTRNRVGYDIILDRAYLPYGRENEIIFSTLAVLEKHDIAHHDSLPITLTQPFKFIEGKESEVARLKTDLQLGEYATAEECMYWLAHPKFYNIQSDGDIQYTQEDIRKIAGVRYEMIQNAFSLSNIFVLASDVGEQMRDIILEQAYKLKGVSIMESPVREYVDGTLAPHVLGITGPMYKENVEQLKSAGLWWSAENPTGYRNNDYLGKSGLEYAFESELRGKSGERTITVDNKGNVISSVDNIAPVPGNTVVTTLDRDLQRAASDALASTIEDYRQTAKSHENGKDSIAGAVVVENPKTGEILALANYPTYDISTYGEKYAELSKMTPEPLLNRATLGVYRPGSTYKPVIATAGFAESIINSGTLVNCTGVYTRFPDYHAKCMHYDGNINVVTALQRSCNIFFYETGWNLGIDRQTKYAEMFGLGNRTGIEINEAEGRISTPAVHQQLGAETWSNGNVIQAAIGQLDHAYTPVQMASYVSTLANNGVRMKSHLVKSIRSYDYKTVMSETKQEAKAIVPLSAEAKEAIKSGMVKATQPGGTSWWLWTGFPYDVASKTGSPEVGGDMLDSVYICYLPADNPEIAISVVIEQGGQGYTGAPVARKIAESYFAGKQDTPMLSSAEVLLP